MRERDRGVRERDRGRSKRDSETRETEKQERQRSKSNRGARETGLKGKKDMPVNGLQRKVDYTIKTQL